MIEIVVPFDVSRCRPNLRLHWAARAREVRHARTAATLAWRAAGSPQMTGPVDVSILVRRARRLDPDNLLASCKGALDGLFCGAITPDDSETWIRYVGVRQETAGQWRGREEVIVTVTPRAGA